MIHIHRALILRRLAYLPEQRNVFGVTLADGTLVIVAEPLLRPEGALTLQVDLVGPEERCPLEARQDWRDLGVQALQLLDGRARPVEVTLSYLRSAFESHERAREILGEELCAVEGEEDGGEESHR